MSFDFNFEFDSIQEYQVQVRPFIIVRLRGFVSAEAFADLEAAFFGDGFGFILQRMWTFRLFRSSGIPRDDCERWFNTWSDDYELDIGTFTDWQFTFEFDIASYIPVVPELTNEFNNVQAALFFHIEGVVTDVNDLEQVRFIIGQFDIFNWNGLSIQY